MGKIICVANQKGGVGKTTTVINLSASLAASQKKSIFIDFDPQGNATSGVGIDKEKLEKSIYNTIIGELSIRETILEIEPQNLGGFLWAAPSNSSLTGAEVELIYIDRREWKLKDVIEPVIDEFDYIFIDCPPSLSILTVNALTAADSVIIPVQCEYYAMEGLGQLKRTISLINQRLNPGLVIEGYLLTMFDRRNNICHTVANEVQNYFKDQVFQTKIPRNVRLAESPSHGKPAFLYDPKSIGATSYFSLAQEIIAKDGGQKIEESYFG
ncbi:AAA family ATPase [Desulfobacterota bacterium AH_259_B03_O07]|nr:AAA family ATPase [Desulfobacterota bacterium AH_259_B03_O07]